MGVTDSPTTVEPDMGRLYIPRDMAFSLLLLDL